MRKVPSAVLAATLLLTLSPTVASAATPKVGASCVKVGQKVKVGNTTFICKKSGRKSAWSIFSISPAPIPEVPVAPIIGDACSPGGQKVRVGTTVYICQKGGPTPVWYLLSSEATGSVPTPPPSGSNQTLLLETVPIALRNGGAFGLSSTHYPEVAQSIVLERDIRLRTISFGFSLLSVAKSLVALKDENYSVDGQTNYQDPKVTTDGDITVSIWRRDDTQLLDTRVSLATGFTKVFQQKSFKTMPSRGDISFELKNSLALRSGSYLVVIHIDFKDPLVKEIRFTGRQAGDNRKGGLNDDLENNCNYTPASDSYPQGRVYRSEETGGAEALDFVRHRSKVPECSVTGVFIDIMNPGDIALSLYGSNEAMLKEATSGQPWSPLSKTANLDRAEYSGMACDPFDPRLEGVALPNGVGPEARVAAACMWLEWLGNADRKTPPITVHLSPTAPAGFASEISRAITDGDRLFGKYAPKVTAYEMLWSNDEAWMCREGATLVEPRLIGLAAERDKMNGTASWASNRNSGCPGSRYAMAGGEPKNLGSDMDIYFTWSLIKPTDFRQSEVEQWMGWVWYLRFMSHEYVHSIQIQRSGTEMIGIWGPWFGEGQAQYLGYTAGSLGAGPGNMRQYVLNELIEDLARAKLSEVRIQDLKFGGGNDALFYSAGYFAYEYLLAHFGSEKLFGLWTAWSGRRTGDIDSIDGRTSQQLGVKVEKLNDEINAYIKAQLTLKK